MMKESVKAECRRSPFEAMRAAPPCSRSISTTTSVTFRPSCCTADSASSEVIVAQRTPKGGPKDKSSVLMEPDQVLVTETSPLFMLCHDCGRP